MKIYSLKDKFFIEQEVKERRLKRMIFCAVVYISIILLASGYDKHTQTYSLSNIIGRHETVVKASEQSSGKLEENTCTGSADNIPSIDVGGANAGSESEESIDRDNGSEEGKKGEDTTNGKDEKVVQDTREVRVEDKKVEQIRGISTHTPEIVTDEQRIAKIKKVYGKYGSKELNNNVEWLFFESIKRGLKPELVFAVQAKESGWGSSYFCSVKKNCFGYGYTDSGKVGNYEGTDYRVVTTKILDKYKVQKYGIGSAYEMAQRGYNFNAEWHQVVHEIESYFN